MKLGVTVLKTGCKRINATLFCHIHVMRDFGFQQHCWDYPAIKTNLKDSSFHLVREISDPHGACTIVCFVGGSAFVPSHHVVEQQRPVSVCIQIIASHLIPWQASFSLMIWAVTRQTMKAIILLASHTLYY